ncbi:MAG: hypothetical protein IJK52_05230 [Oscillospiraceae bacterium]|nr:hypothetical protein [Oscillospiraceae bacterium]
MKKADASETSHKGHRENVRRRYLIGGLEVFAPHEILELLLYYAIPRKDTNPLAHRLIDTCGSLSRVLSSSPQKLQTVEGVGERTAVFLSLVFQISRLTRLEELRDERIHFTSTKEIAAYLQALFEGKDFETVYELCLNQRGDLIMRYSMTNGSIVSVSMDIVTLVKNALVCKSAYVVISHNHPGGDARPSREDYDATRRMEDAFANVNIKLWDHIIIGKDNYVSLRESQFFHDT